MRTCFLLKIWQYIFKVNIRKAYDSIKTRKHKMHIINRKKNIQDKIYLEVESRISLISFVDITK